MKNLLFLLTFTIMHSVSAQYLDTNNVNFLYHSDGLSARVACDSTILIKLDSNEEIYKVYRVNSRQIFKSNFASIKKVDSLLFFKLDLNSADTNYHFLYNLNFKVGDSFYLKSYPKERYFYRNNSNPSIVYDSVLMKIDSIKLVNYYGRYLKTTYFKQNATNFSYRFIDSIGYVDFGNFGIGKGDENSITYICKDGQVVYKNNFLEPYCDKNTFYSKYIYSGSIQDFTKSNFNMYPNPATEELIINSITEDPIEKIQIYDYRGKSVLYQKPNNESSQMTLKLSDLES
ncbi:MAG: T9SS type A sorting domain-containing protein, partial [Bacteroidia bacterium]